MCSSRKEVVELHEICLEVLNLEWRVVPPLAGKKGQYSLYHVLYPLHWHQLQGRTLQNVLNMKGLQRVSNIFLCQKWLWQVQ